MSDNRKDITESLSDQLAAGGQFYRRPGARLTEPQAEVVKRIGETPAVFHDGYHAFDLAHVVMLTEQGIISRSTGQTILDSLLRLEDKNGDAKSWRTDIGHGIHSGEVHVINECGEDIGGWLHIGRSGHDLIAVAERFIARRRLLSIAERILQLIETYTQRAAEMLDVPIPTYTGLQRAQVATVGFHLCSLAFPHKRDVERVFSLYPRLNQSPAGAAVGTTSDFELDRERVALLLGFDGISPNGEDIDKSVDIQLEMSSLLASVAANLSVAADRFLLWHSQEYDLLELPDRLAGTSSIMPHKKNPHSIQTIQRDTNEVISDVFRQHTAAKNIGGGVCIEPDISDQIIEDLNIWTEVVACTQYDRDRAAALVTDSWVVSTDLAALLVRDGNIPWRSAHQIIATVIRHLEEADRSIDDLSADRIQTVTKNYCGVSLDITDQQLEQVLDPERTLDRRSETVGSPAPSQVESQISALREEVSKYNDIIQTRWRDLSDAHDKRYHAINSILDS